MDTRDLSNHESYRAGRGIVEVARNLGKQPDELLKLSSNENSLGPSPRAVQAINEYAEESHLYPKASHADLTSALAEKWNVEAEQIWLSNGGDGALDCLARAMIRPGDEVLVPHPGFAYYGMSARYHHASVREYQLSMQENFSLTAEKILDYYEGERIIYVNTPHNPTGAEMKLEEVENLSNGTNGDTVLLVDEAYGEFSEQPSAVKLVRERDDVCVLRSFSKSYGLAGLRLGYLIAPTDWSDAYAKIHTPFDSGELACRAGLAALGDEDHLSSTVEMVKAARDYLRENIEAKTWESGGNFILVEVGDAEEVTEELKESGIIVRNCSSFGLDDCIRITCGPFDQMKRTVESLNQILTK